MARGDGNGRWDRVVAGKRVGMVAVDHARPRAHDSSQNGTVEIGWIIGAQVPDSLWRGGYLPAQSLELARWFSRGIFDVVCPVSGERAPTRDGLA